MHLAVRRYLGISTKQAKPITPDKEELLCSKNLLGVYLCGTCLLSTTLDAAMSLINMVLQVTYDFVDSLEL